MYRVFTIPKANGSIRIISAPNAKMKAIQKKLAEVLNLVYEPKVCAYGFIPKRNYINNAERHIGRAFVLNFDLKNFFTQIHFGRVRGTLMAKPYNLTEEVATTIAQIACLNGVLPQGAPTSPILSNMVCRPLDNQLMRVAKDLKCLYTRYADDLSFSSFRSEVPHELAAFSGDKIQMGKVLKDTLKKNSFEVNPEKVFLSFRYQHQEVTGLTVNKRVNIKRGYLKNIRAIMHCCEKAGIYKSAQIFIEKGLCKNSNIYFWAYDDSKQEIVENWFKAVLKGKINFVKQVRGNEDFVYLSLASKMNSIFNEKVFDTSSFDDINILIDNNVFLLQTNDKFNQGSGFYLENYGLITSYHLTEDEEYFNVYRCLDKHKEKIAIVGKTLNELASDFEIDFALYKYSHKSNYSFRIGDSITLKQGDTVIIVGFPKYNDGDTCNRQTCQVTSQIMYFGFPLYTVSGRIVHGSSGGVVLNMRQEVVGLIKAGVENLKDADNDDKQGFVPIHYILEYLEINKKQEIS